MKKIPSVFQRNYEGDRLCRDEVTPGCEWVLAGEGTPTRKWDGTSCMVRDGRLYKRYDAKSGKAPPPGFEPCQPEPDPHTGHHPGWLHVGDGPEDRWHREASATLVAPLFIPGERTYELVGPKVNGNRDKLSEHRLIPHQGTESLLVSGDPPRTFDGLRDWLSKRSIEGIVFHHPDGRMAKVKRTDFGLPWPAKTSGEVPR